MVTEDEIRTQVFRFIKQTPLASLVTGRVINGRDRAANATSEDIVIKVNGNNLAQKQEAFVIVNIYTQDVLMNGEYVPNDERIPLVERAALDLFETAKRVGDARLSLPKDGQKLLASQNGREHVVSNKLLYQIINE